MTSKVYFLYVLKFSGSFVKISEFVQSQWMSFGPMRGGENLRTKHTKENSKSDEILMTLFAYFILD